MTPPGQEPAPPAAETDPDPGSRHFGTAFRRKRLALLLDRQTAADYIGVSPATIRNWERRSLPSGKDDLGGIQRSFVQGDYDDDLGRLVDAGRYRRRRPPSGPDDRAALRGLGRRVGDVFRLCRDVPVLQEELVRRLWELAEHPPWR